MYIITTYWCVDLSTLGGVNHILVFNHFEILFLVLFFLMTEVSFFSLKLLTASFNSGSFILCLLLVSKQNIGIFIIIKCFTNVFQGSWKEECPSGKSRSLYSAGFSIKVFLLYMDIFAQNNFLNSSIFKMYCSGP